MTAPEVSPDPSTRGDEQLLAELLAERFPTAAEVRAEAHRPTPAPPLVVRGTTAVTVDTLHRDAQDAVRFASRQQNAEARRIEARIAAARKLTAAARRKRAG